MMRGVIVIIAAVVMQACLGGIYAWSAFVPPLHTTFGYSVFQTQLPFGTCICTFTIAAIWTGRLQDRYGPRPLALASAAFLAAGYLLAWLSGHGGLAAAVGAVPGAAWLEGQGFVRPGNFMLLWGGAGVLGGLGIACGYVVPIATAVKWFPRHKGLVCGLAVAGYGAGAIALSGVVTALLRQGWNVLEIFRVVGLVYAAIVAVAGMLMFLPPGSRQLKYEAFPRRPLLRQGRFWLLVLGIFCSTFPGLMIIGNLKSIGEAMGVGSAVATLAISTLAAGNALGRVSWGVIYDRLGGRRAMRLSMAAVLLSVAAVLLVGQWGAGFLVAAALAGFAYGGCFAIYPARVAQWWGPHFLGSVYPLILLAHGLAAPFGPSLGGLSKDLTGSFATALVAAGSLTLIGMIVVALLERRSAGT